jgi:hypothetical protein
MRSHVAAGEAVPVLPPTELMEALQLTEEEPANQLINRILATLLERQATTDESIEISNVTCRTARYRLPVINNF